MRRALLLVVMVGACGSDKATGPNPAATSTAEVPRTYSIPSCAMAPTLQIGGKVAVDPSKEPDRGDIVVYRAGDMERVSRVVAVSGDRLEARDGRLVVNGTVVEEPYLSPGTTTVMPSAALVGTESYFVLGDNRSNSADSRVFGPLAATAVVGRATVLSQGEGC